MVALGVNSGAAFDHETILIMKSSLDAAWEQLGSVEQAKTSKSVLASRILRAAAQGERDPVRLRTYALLHVVPPSIGG
jgi:hypothetical protein